MEEKEDEEKDQYYELLERQVQKIPKYNIEIIIGD